ncbi:MAG: HDOD domain-containing protein [Bacteroidetes bacterium]|nr:HDOD domain-containing protein [Bacteroidota bacterium]HOV99662.1 HDOD domain-containing protein [Bacteroidota bacterium]
MQNEVDQHSLMILATGANQDQQCKLEKVLGEMGEKLTILPNFQDILIVGSKRKLDIVFVFLENNPEDHTVILKNLRSLQPEAWIVLLSDDSVRSEALNYIAAGYANEHLLLPLQHEDAIEFAKRIVNTRRDFRYQNLQSALASFVNLPVPERFHSRLRYLLSREGVSLNEIINEIEKNPALVAKILRVANSVHYATRAPIISLREAIIFIGTNYLETLIMAVDLFERFVIGRNPQIKMMYEKLWDSSLRRALIAKNIAESSDSKSEASTIHVAALLQDIGLLARLCTTPEKYLTMMKLKEGEQISQYISEFRVFGTTHDEVGAALLRRWNFPQEVIFIVANHHGETFGNDSVRIVQIADSLDPDGVSEPHDESLIPEIQEWAERFEPIFERTKE